MSPGPLSTIGQFCRTTGPDRSGFLLSMIIQLSKKPKKEPKVIVKKKQEKEAKAKKPKEIVRPSKKDRAGRPGFDEDILSKVPVIPDKTEKT